MLLTILFNSVGHVRLISVWGYLKIIIHGSESLLYFQRRTYSIRRRTKK